VWRYAGKRVGTFATAGLVLLLPSSSIFPAADLAADRRMYLPMFAFTAALAILLARLKPEPIAAGLLIVLTGLSFLRTQVWMTERTLWTEAVKRSPAKVRPKIQLARAVPAAQALELLSRAREEHPYDAALSAEIGKTLLSEGQPDAALNEFGRALALNPRDARSFNNRGVALQQLGQTDAARMDFQKALELDPKLTEAAENLRKLPPER
jgi:tetratricopeptide (TPR) repeat protein